MEELFGLILFLLFVLAPLLGRKKKPQADDAPRARTGARTRPEYDRPHGTTARAPRTTPEATTTGGEGSAAEMLPEDLWRILTGQAPPRTAPLPAPPEPELDTDEDAFEAEPDELRWEEPVSLETEPEIISLESTKPREEPVRRSYDVDLPTPQQRHRAFHEKVAALKPIRVRRVQASPLARLLSDRDALMRAVVLREVLGPPKGLED